MRSRGTNIPFSLGPLLSNDRQRKRVPDPYTLNPTTWSLVRGQVLGPVSHRPQHIYFDRNRCVEVKRLGYGPKGESFKAMNPLAFRINDIVVWTGKAWGNPRAGVKVRSNPIGGEAPSRVPLDGA
jgi:hypothetical protein